MSGDIQIRTIFERWERLEGEKKAIGDDLKELFSEAKHAGYDSKALRAAFNRKVKQDSETTADQQFDMVVDTYLDAINGIARDARMRARENIEKFDPETGEILEDINPRLAKRVVDGMQTEAGRAALVAAVDILIEREEAEETQERLSTNDKASPEAGPQAEASPAGIGAGTLADREGRHEGEAAPADLPTNSKTDAAISRPGIASLGRPEIENRSEKEAPEAGASGGMQDDIAIHPAANSQSDDDAVAEVKGDARLANVNDVEPSSSVQVGPTEDRREGHSLDGDADANAGGDHVTAQENAATLNNRLDGVPVQPAGGITFETVPPRPMKSLSYAHCFPELTKIEYQCLAGDIALNGVLVPIIRMGDIIVDGWNRYNAARSLGIEYPVMNYSGDDVLIDVISWQRASRKWTPEQERKIAISLSKIVPHRSNDIWKAFDQAPVLLKEEVAA